MSFALYAVFFLSGCAALLFETLWFRQAGLMLGNSVWSSSIVLASFMAGLGAGNLAAARRGARLRRPVRVYAGLEALIGLSGLLIVVSFPALTRGLAPLIASVAPNDALLNATRLAVAFVLLILPASAMGATLPVLVSALGGEESRFGRTLGRLYGWNTLGAVAGALAGELFLIERFGLTGTGAVAATLNLVAALVASRLNDAAERRGEALGRDANESRAESAAADGATDARPAVRDLPPTVDLSRPASTLRDAWPTLAAAFLAGAILLALEVIWFRFLLLFTMGTSAAFAVMLAAVLAGIALGGLLGSSWLARRPDATRALPLVALLAGAGVAGTYAGFARLAQAGLFQSAFAMSDAAAAALTLTLPASLLSGLLFTLLGQALRRRVADETRAAGVLTLANTLGAMLGAFLGGLVLLPGLGIERSLVALAAAYAAVALLALPDAARGAAWTPRLRLASLAAALAFLATLALFPFGLMSGTFLPRIWRTYGTTVLAEREGLTETAVYLSAERWGEPVQHVLVTNGHSMSATTPRAVRYMRLFSYLPLALQPQARSALVISFGLGSTLDALTQSRQLESIDLVDISRDILRLGRLVYPPPRRYPLDDPRVRVHVEDGRFFLLTSRRQFDVITAEPPPPKNAGIVNLYSKEYFQLMRARLRQGGLATYWLPVQQLTLDDTRAITRGFCEAFDDCTLWTGFGMEWMLVGTRDGRAPDEEAFTALWRDPVAARSLSDIGLPLPEQLGTTFMADAEQMRAWLGDARPLEDDFPLRLSVRLPGRLSPAYGELVDPAAARRRFADSAWVRRMWPAAMRERTLERFTREAALLGYLAYPLESVAWVPELHALAGDPAARTVVLWMMQRSPAIERAALGARARGLRDPQLDLDLGVAAFADGRYLEAEELFHRAQRHVLGEWLVEWRVLALALGGERERAARLTAEAGDWVQANDKRGWGFLISTYDLPDPWGLTAATGARP